MKQRQLGKGGPMVGEVGFGAMSLAGAFGPTDDATSRRTLARALDFGVTHIDTALIYGPYRSEEIIGAFLHDNPGAKAYFPSPPRAASGQSRAASSTNQNSCVMRLKAL
jgi:aryl-alcohol dehydrogenase-like predicted oxidoreductase